MKHEENNRTNRHSETSDFLHDKKAADQLFQNIVSELELTPSLTRHSGCAYHRRFIGRYVLRGTCVLAATCLFAFCGTGFLQKPAISRVKAAPSSNAASATVTFQVDALFPVRDVSASLNEKTINVDTLGNNGYSIEVSENGYLLLEVVSISGIRSEQGLSIDSIDDQAPVIVSHMHTGSLIEIHVRDIGDSGVDYDGIYATTSSGMIKPESFDAADGLVVFPYPSEDMYITIPDKNGNRLVSLLQPADESGTEESR